MKRRPRDEERLYFPFVVRCIAERAISPLRVDDEVDVVEMGPEEECHHEIFVLIRWERRTLGGSLGSAGGHCGGTKHRAGRAS